MPSRLGLGLGIGICEDFWHLPVPQLLALDGAQLLINVSSSPGRDLAATNEVGLGTATSWRTLMRTYAQLTTSFVVFCNRVGVDESITFWGGSEVIGPNGQAVFSAPLHDEGLFTVDIAHRPTSGASGSRCRCCATSVSSSTSASSAGSWPSGPAWPTTRRPSLAPSRVSTSSPPRRRPSRSASRSTASVRGRSTAGHDVTGPTGTGPAVDAPFELPTELAIDTDVARRVIAGFIRGQLEQAGFERAVLGLSGGIDSALVAYLVAEAIGAERLLAVLMPYRTSSPASRADAETVVTAAGLCQRARRDQRRWSTGTSGAGRRPGRAGPRA